MWQYGRVDMAGTWANQQLTHGIHRLVGKVPRGPVKGCHVAPHDWLLVMCIKFGLAWPGVEPVTSRQANGLAERASHPGGRWYLLYHQRNIFI
jgi:hypothetical protein